MTRWSNPISLEATLAELHRRGGANRLSSGGASEADLALAVQRLGLSLPADLRHLLQSVSPETWNNAQRAETGFRLYAADELFSIRPRTDTEKHVWASQVCHSEFDRAWADSTLIAFAGDDMFNYMCVCLDPPVTVDGLSLPPNALIWADHEWDIPVRVMASSLAQWLDRYIACGMFEPAVYPGDSIPAPIQVQLEYFEHYNLLNPRDHWGRERRGRLLLAQRPPTVDEVHIYDATAGVMQPLSACVGLTSLSLDADQARSLAPLRSVTNLRELRLEIGKDKDLSPLASLRILTCLTIRGKGLELGPLAGLPSLEWVTLDHSEVRSFSPLASCPSLRLLQINEVRCGDWPSLCRLHQVQRLHADSIGIRTLEAFGELESLAELAIDRTKIDSLEPLRKLRSLEKLSISATRVRRLDPLAAIPSLTALNFHDTKVSDIELLESHPHLERVDASRTRISSVASLAGAAKLQRLDIGFTDVDDLAPLAGKTHLQELECNETSIADLTPLSTCRSLTWVLLDDCPVTTLVPLFELERLEFLSCRRTSVPEHELGLLRERFPHAAIYGDNG